MSIKLGKGLDMSPDAMKMRIDKFRIYTKRAFDNKLKMNAEICGFLIITPRNKRTKCTLYFNKVAVGYIGDGEFTVEPFDSKVFSGENKFKYDVLVGIQEELTGKIEEDDTEEEITEETKEDEVKAKSKKPAAKRKSVKRKGTKK